MNWLSDIKARFDRSDFEVARSVRLSLVEFDDPDRRRYEMKLWCRDECAERWVKRWTDRPDEARFDFENEEDALLFFLRWC